MGQGHLPHVPDLELFGSVSSVSLSPPPHVLVFEPLEALMLAEAV